MTSGLLRIIARQCPAAKGPFAAEEGVGPRDLAMWEAGLEQKNKTRCHTATDASGSRGLLTQAQEVLCNMVKN